MTSSTPVSGSLKLRHRCVVVARKSWLFIPFVSTVLVLLQLTACEHPPVMPDTSMPVDTTPVDTFHPCDPDTVYFQQDVLPILIANCALGGCHNAQTAADGVILDTYEKVLATADIKTDLPASSNLYEVLVDQDSSDRMPLGAVNPLPQSEIDLILKWIEQGAQNLNCDPDPSQCDTIGVSFAAVIMPMMQTHECLACHTAGNPNGGVKLTDHATIKAAADNGSLLGTVEHQAGYSPMPKNEPKLSDCEISQLRGWINDEALDN